MSAPIQASAALLNSRLVKNLPSNPQLFADYLSGAAVTLSSRPKPEPKAGRLPPGLARLIGPQGEVRRQKRVRDRTASRARKRTLGASGCMPHSIRCHYSEGERAALTVIGLEVKRRGLCDWPVERIAAQAGVSIRTVQYALATARHRDRLHIKVEYRKVTGARNKTSVITVVSAEWLAWLKRGPSLSSINRALDEGIGCKEVQGMKKGVLYPDRFERGSTQFRPFAPSGDTAKGAYEGMRGRRRAQPISGGRADAA